MKVLSEKTENNQATLQLEIELAEIEAASEKAYRRLVPRLNIPGFRKGKAPRSIVEQQIGKDSLVEEALEDLIPELLDEALKARSMQAVGAPEIKIVNREPITVEAVIPLMPTVKCGDYKAIRVEREAVEVKDENVDQSIKAIQEQQATLVAVERPVQYGDVVAIDIDGVSEGKPVLSRKGTMYEVVEGSPVPVPGFAENLVGLAKEGAKEFTIGFPAEHEIKELAGKQFTFTVKVNEVQEKKVPALDETFAKSVGQETVEAFKTYVKDQLVARAKEANQRAYERKVLDAAVAVCEVSYPASIVERDLDNQLHEESLQFKDGVKGMEAYLKNMNKTLEQHREDLRPNTVKRLLDDLVIDKLAEEEKIEVTAEEIDKQIDNLAQSSGDKAGEFRRVLDTPEGRHRIEHSVRDRKTVDRLVEIAEGKSPVSA